ncbi:MAG: tyrosine decarboxylase MfnA [Haloquadratum sp.]|jgi:tyrosine decarboxylase/aspartate 1-decarboxylase|nr:tyrosine decarboxylase MfnA [Haloferacaceae archaeon]MDR9444909.1 tyrosine decarboxylase MfnA [Haloquadratum sp.]
MTVTVPQSFETVISSMCTAPHPAAVAAAERFLASNPGDPATYQAVAAHEQRAVRLLAEITSAPTATGYITSGGTEANIQAMRAARERQPTADATIVIGSHAHFSFQKAAAVLGMRCEVVPTGADHRADPDAVAERVDADTAAVVAVAGSTSFGRIDPIRALTEVAHDAGAVCHLDAAWGGFYLPFTDAEWDFAATGIDSMTIDPHKAGRSVIPSGGLLFADPAAAASLRIETPYLASADQYSLTGTRSGAGVAGAAAAMEALWPEGYAAEYERAMALAETVATACRERGFETPDVELPLVATRLPEGVLRELREAGWRIAATPAGYARIVLMPHVTEAMIAELFAMIDTVA